MKTRLLVDINPVRKPYFSNGVKRRNSVKLNLSFSPWITIPFKNLLRAVFILPVVLFFVFGSVTAPVSGGARAAQNEEERKVLESELVKYEKEIEQHEAAIALLKKQGKTLTSEINQLNNKIAKLNLQIKAVNLTLNKLDSEISNTQGQISLTESEIVLNKKNLSQLLQVLYENDNQSLVEVLFKNPQLSDFFGDMNNMLAVQDNLRAVIVKVIEARQKLVDQKEVLALEREDAVALKSYQDAQRASVQKTQSDKNSLLKVTKGKESEYQKLLIETKKTAAEIRKQIFKFLGGGQLEFGDAYNLAKIAEQATGVRAALILAVLDRESALGKNVGQCDYKTATHPTRDIPIFLEIIKELGFEKKLEDGLIKVSCAISSDGAYGGAMGPAQFIPSTWNIYKDRIAKLTGNNPANPWNNEDAFMGTALYLKDSGAGAGASLADERKAAAKYYAGSRWSRYLSTYGSRVVAQAQKFEEDIAILSS
ncbi:MAG: lytic murein transglycosylase [bacterium]|nr:lytic murein transglycosylase [bacterium]